jgi:putative membrane protein
MRSSLRWMAALRGFVLTVAFLPAATAAMAQAGRRVWEPTSFGYAVLSTVVFGLLGIVMTIVGFKLFDAFVQFNLAQEICEKQNMAVAILCGAMVLGISIIVAVSIL